MAVEEGVAISFAGSVHGAEARDLMVKFPFGSQVAELRIPRAIARSGPVEEWADAVAAIRHVGAFLAAVRIQPTE